MQEYTESNSIRSAILEEDAPTTTPKPNGKANGKTSLAVYLSERETPRCSRCNKPLTADELESSDALDVLCYACEAGTKPKAEQTPPKRELRVGNGRTILEEPSHDPTVMCLYCGVNPRRQDTSDYCQSCWKEKQSGVDLQRVLDWKDGKWVKVEPEKKTDRTGAFSLSKTCRRKGCDEPLKPGSHYCAAHYAKLTRQGKIDDINSFKPRCEECKQHPVMDGHTKCRECFHYGKTKLKATTSLDFPEAAMYGWLGELARKIDGPLSAAYPVLLAMAAPCVQPYKRLRPNLYVNIIGGAGDGKTRVINNARETWLTPPEVGVVSKYPGSEIGLIQFLGGKKAKDTKHEDRYPKPYLLIQDEMRITFNKMDIKGSSLPNMLNHLFYHDDFGTGSKQGDWECFPRLSVVGGLTCKNPDEFAEIYGLTTTQGTYDRTLFGIMPTDWEFDDMWEPPMDTTVNPITDGVEPAPITRIAKPCAIPKFAYDAVAEWRRKDMENRKRLGELILRVALVTASLNHDKEVTPECLQCAILFIEWQEQLRRHYKPSETDDLDGKAERALVRALEKYENWVEWKTLTTSHNLYRAAGSAKRLNNARFQLMRSNVIEDEMRLNERTEKLEPTGRLRLLYNPYSSDNQGDNQ